MKDNLINFAIDFENLILKYGYAYPLFIVDGQEIENYDIIHGEVEDKDGSIVNVIGFYVGHNIACPCCREKHDGALLDTKKH